LVENRFFILPHLGMAPPLRVTPSKFCRDLWRRKTRVCRLWFACLRDPVFSHFGTMPACDRPTDRQTNTHTQYHSIYRVSI